MDRDLLGPARQGNLREDDLRKAVLHHECHGGGVLFHAFDVEEVYPVVLREEWTRTRYQVRGGGAVSGAVPGAVSGAVSGDELDRRWIGAGSGSSEGADRVSLDDLHDSLGQALGFHFKSRLLRQVGDLLLRHLLLRGMLRRS